MKTSWLDKNLRPKCLVSCQRDLKRTQRFHLLGHKMSFFKFSIWPCPPERHQTLAQVPCFVLPTQIMHFFYFSPFLHRYMCKITTGCLLRHWETDTEDRYADKHSISIIPSFQGLFCWMKIWQMTKELRNKQSLNKQSLKMETKWRSSGKSKAVVWVR